MSDLENRRPPARRPLDRAALAALGALGFCLALGVVVSAVRLILFGR